MLLAPINLKRWIEEHRELLKPPVGNQTIWQDTDFTVMVVGGPNSRTDYHINEGEELFYQLEGTVTLKVLDSGLVRGIELNAGDLFLLPALVPHSPQRGAGTIGLVIEKRRLPDQKDGFLWLCENCGKKLHAEYLHVADIVKDLPLVFDRFFDNDASCTCQHCGKKAVRK